MLNATANCSKEVWEFEGLRRSAREALSLIPPITTNGRRPFGGHFLFCTPTRHSPHANISSCDVFAQFASTKCGNDRHEWRTHL
jgi:hypothetical protein